MVFSGPNSLDFNRKWNDDKKYTRTHLWFVAMENRWKKIKNNKNTSPEKLTVPLIRNMIVYIYKCTSRPNRNYVANVSVHQLIFIDCIHCDGGKNRATKTPTPTNGTMEIGQESE